MLPVEYKELKYQIIMSTSTFSSIFKKRISFVSLSNSMFICKQMKKMCVENMPETVDNMDHDTCISCRLTVTKQHMSTCNKEENINTIHVL